ncbi:hypothetical protein I350_07773 [Cryptococcus amylolentus CBS 6273]|uniref:Uncharacterized protein n=1 Tax=Cryptococcus amylolentus CBS 6273 TaxID=1296118 RepID=A0A1E3JB77_9TREE|nr:hypothetical protein I350_07773 [Cryptococcus amylolentus CBS 6273]
MSLPMSPVKEEPKLKPRPVSLVRVDEDGTLLDAVEAAGRPYIGVSEDGAIIHGPPVTTAVPLRSDLDSSRVDCQSTPFRRDGAPHQFSGVGPTSPAPASDSQSSQNNLNYHGLQVIIKTMHQQQAELQRGQIDPPKLPLLSSLCTSPLGVVRHLQDLANYFANYSSRFLAGNRVTPQWQVTQANRSIAKVDAYHSWSMAIGATCATWDHWRREFKKKALSSNWEADTRRVFEGLQCQGTSMAAWEAFEEKAGECQMILSDCLGLSPRRTCDKSSYSAFLPISTCVLRTPSPIVVSTPTLCLFWSSALSSSMLSKWRLLPQLLPPITHQVDVSSGLLSTTWSFRVAVRRSPPLAT